jgi:outer membrane protein assembly factor BamB
LDPGTSGSTGCAPAAQLPRKRRIAWTFEPTLPPVGGQQVSWWEGNPAIGPGGTIYVGNTGGAAYAINSDGTQRWAAERGQSVWTTPAFGEGSESGNTFWGSVDLYAFSLNQNGGLRWQTFTPGYVTSSPALGSDGTVYVGSFDHRLYALDPDTGQVRWVVPHRCPHLRLARAAHGAAGSDFGDLRRIGRRLGLRARPGGPPALAL